MKKQNLGIKKEMNGITLIALVITIIVLLILAGISIATLTGENGILTQASKASETTKEESAREKIAVEVAGSRGTDGKIDIDTLKGNLSRINVGNLDLITSLPARVNLDGYDFLISTNGSVLTSIEPGVVIDTTKADNYADGNGKIATIPKGFKVSEKEGEQTIDEGLVVIGPDGSEFVWIPVETAVAISEEEGTKTKAMAINKGTESSPEYRGLLYTFRSDGSEVLRGCTTTDESRREPDIIKDNDEITANLQIINEVLGTNLSDEDQFKEELQREYNEMIESVKKYGGFYIGRYEASEVDGKTVSKANSTAININGNTWYGLYAKARKYNEEGVKSSMLYSTQYDAMLNWLQGKGVDVVRTTPPDGVVKNGSTETTGVPGSTDVVKNIYDLYGGKWEGTIEATKISNGTGRTFRGGRYGTRELSLSSVGNVSVTATGATYGTRMTVHII